MGLINELRVLLYRALPIDDREWWTFWALKDNDMHANYLLPTAFTWNIKNIPQDSDSDSERIVKIVNFAQKNDVIDFTD